MQRIGFRLLRIAVVALVAWGAFALLEPRGLGWAVIPAAIVATVAVTGARWLWLRRRNAAGHREAAWAEATVDPARRPEAIAQVRRAIAGAGGSGAAGRASQARLKVLLAQLLDADGKNGEARRLLDAIDLSPLDVMDASLVRHGRAAMRLRADDPKGALEALAGRPRSGARELDLRLDLLEASAQLETGEAETALATATRVRRAAGGDEELLVEARVVRAAALDALGQRDEALTVVRSLGSEMIDLLALLGQRRVRELAAAARVDGGS